MFPDNCLIRKCKFANRQNCMDRKKCERYHGRTEGRIGKAIRKVRKVKHCLRVFFMFFFLFLILWCWFVWVVWEWQGVSQIKLKTHKMRVGAWFARGAYELSPGLAPCFGEKMIRLANNYCHFLFFIFFFYVFGSDVMWWVRRCV